MMANLAASLAAEAIETTEAKASRPYAEKLITKAKSEVGSNTFIVAVNSSRGPTTRDACGSR